MQKKIHIYKFIALILSFTVLMTTLPSSVYATVGTVSNSSSESSGDTSNDSSASSGDTSGESSDTSTDSGNSASTVDTETGFTVNSTAVYLVNMDSGIVIYEKNADTPMYPASLAKIMTCLLPTENCDDLTGSVVTPP